MAKMGELKMPYLYGEAQSALETSMEREMHYNAPEMESQWKQPWKYDSYPKMEAELAWPGQAPYPQPPGGPADCGISGKYRTPKMLIPCSGSFDFEFNCASQIVSVEPVEAEFMGTVQYAANDTLIGAVITTTEKRDAGVTFGVRAWIQSGRSYHLLFTPTCQCGADCDRVPTELTVSYTPDAITYNQTKTLTASGGLTSKAKPYKWTIVSGGGTLSYATGTGTTYTPNCPGEVVIKLTDCCNDWKLATFTVTCGGSSVTYDTQQMSCNGQQTLNAGGGKAPYTWELIAGTGSLSESSGPTTVYTAPATNADCTNNPTIRLSDSCPCTVDIKLAINCYGTAGVAYGISRGIFYSGGACAGISQNCFCVDAKNCDGSNNNTPCAEIDIYSEPERVCSLCGICNIDGVSHCRITDTNCYYCTGICANACTEVNLLNKDNYIGQGCLGSTDWTGMGWDQVKDVRTTAMKTGGCCPAALIV